MRAFCHELTSDRARRDGLPWRVVGSWESPRCGAVVAGEACLSSRSWPRWALPLVWPGSRQTESAQRLSRKERLSRYHCGGPLDGAGHGHPKFYEARDTIVTMKPMDPKEDEAMRDVERGQNATHERSGASVPVVPGTARPSRPGVLERTATLIERVNAECLFLAVALPWGLGDVERVVGARVVDHDDGRHPRWDAANGPQRIREPRARRSTARRWEARFALHDHPLPSGAGEQGIRRWAGVQKAAVEDASEEILTLLAAVEPVAVLVEV